VGDVKAIIKEKLKREIQEKERRMEKQRSKQSEIHSRHKQR